MDSFNEDTYLIKPLTADNFLKKL